MLQREIDIEAAADIAKFEEQMGRYLAGDLAEDVFRVFRLNNGIYGQRQGGTSQMVRIKAPYGSITAEQLDMMAHIGETYSRGWGHITTRQNVQFHFVELEQVPEVMRLMASVGLTSREACGDTVRNVMACHLAGACPFEAFDVSPWADAAFQHFLRHPFAQRLPRKFKINFSGCDTDCGQAMFNDAGVIATTRTLEDGTVEQGFRVFIAGGLGANPHPALALEDFTPKEDLLATLESILRVFEQTGNRDNKLRARLKWVVDELGIDEVRRRVIKTRHFLLASSSWPGGIPETVQKLGDAPAGIATGVTPTVIGQGTPVALRGTKPYERWVDANVIRGVAKGTVSAIAYARLGDITTEQFRALASITRELGLEVRLTNRQNIAFRGLTEAQLPTLYARLEAISMAEPGAELARDVVACPGADTCNLAVTQSRGLADAIGTALEEAGLAEVGGVRTNISGCTNSCGQHHAVDIGFFGAERRAHGQSAPGYQMLLGGYVGQEQMHFGQKALRLPAHNAPEAAVRVIRQFADGREAGESFRTWMERSGGVTAVADTLRDLDQFPTPDEAPEFYVDYGETGPYVAEIGESECANMSNATVFTGTGSDGFDSQPKSPEDFTDAELADLSVEFERLPATKIIQWAVDNFSPHLALTASMTDAVLIDLAVQIYPAIEVAFIDTGYHFPETLETVEEVRRRYGLNMKIMTVARQNEALWEVDPENCCSAVKVGQLDRALLGKSAWMSGLRRSEADTRIKAPLVARDLRGLIKINPIAMWTDEDVAGYIADHDVPVNPLIAQGYLSIGCMPCTVPAVDPDDPRSGRWAGRDKTECGLHSM